MPQNFPPSQPDTVAAELFPGNSIDHIEAVRNVLLNYNRALESELSKLETAGPSETTGGD
jgi:hypothetical protein